MRRQVKAKQVVVERFGDNFEKLNLSFDWNSRVGIIHLAARQPRPP